MGLPTTESTTSLRLPSCKLKLIAGVREMISEAEQKVVSYLLAIGVAPDLIPEVWAFDDMIIVDDIST